MSEADTFVGEAKNVCFGEQRRSMARNNATRSLLDYQAKRDFGKTSEPSGIGANKIKPSEHLRFVIQKHDATRLHYDLRLELGDIFKSWAVTRGPSLEPSEKRLAVEVHFHRCPLNQLWSRHSRNCILAR